MDYIWYSEIYKIPRPVVQSNETMCTRLAGICFLSHKFRYLQQHFAKKPSEIQKLYSIEMNSKNTKMTVEKPGVQLRI